MAYNSVSPLHSQELPEAPSHVETSVVTMAKKVFSSPQEKALLDLDHKISEEFAIPEGFEKRVGFWLDIYTKYDSKHYVIHHRDYPWVIFDVVDATDLYKQERVTWLNKKDAETLASSKVEAIKATLNMLLVRADYNNLPEDEKRVYQLIKDLPGASPRKIIKETLKGLRTQLGQKDMFESGLKNSSAFLPAMEEIFAEHGLPKQLVRIPLVESSFNIVAESRVGARGVWQIMPEVGKSSMIINASIDERQSPLKSTIFAAKMLKQNYRALKSWPLTVTSYNHGVTSLLREVKKLNTKDLNEIIQKNNSESFQFASENFYACFLAALRGEQYSQDFFPELKRTTPVKLNKVTLAKGLVVNKLPQKLGFSLQELQEANADLSGKLKPNFKLPDGFQMFVPEKSEKGLSKLQSMNDSVQ